MAGIIYKLDTLVYTIWSGNGILNAYLIKTQIMIFQKGHTHFFMFSKSISILNHYTAINKLWHKNIRQYRFLPAQTLSAVKASNFGDAIDLILLWIDR